MQHLDKINGAIMFTDIKDFTLKTSLLTQKQINKLLDTHDSIVLSIFEKYNSKIVKTIGDAYMVVFENPKEAIKSAIEIQKSLIELNKDKKINLYKIEVRITIDYGVLNRKEGVKGEDFFGDNINVASRLQSITPENRIYISGECRRKLLDNENFYFLGKTSFKGVLYEVDVYDVIFDEEEIKLLKKGEFKKGNIEKLINNKISKTIKEIDDFIFKMSSVGAFIAIQPIPFIDIYSSMVLNLYMMKEISNKYGIRLSTKDSKKILATILTIIGSNYAISQSVIGFTKLGLPGLSSFINIPLYFAMTYSMGKVFSYYFYYQSQELEVVNQDIKDLFKYSCKEAKKISKDNKKEILKVGVKNKDKVISKLKGLRKSFKISSHLSSNQKG